VTSVVRLSVNVDHVATLRQARGTSYPDPVDAARLAEEAGAHGVTVHLRSDRRHIQERDVAALRATVRGKLNLEMAASDQMLTIARTHRPHQVTLVPERPDELTTEGGLDLITQGERVRRVAAELAAVGVAVSLFIDPDPRQIDRLTALAAVGVEGFELNTDAYARASGGDVATTLRALRRAAQGGHATGLAVYAGHALTVGNVAPVAALPDMEELNIGHALVSRAVLVGLTVAVREMLEAMGHRRPVVDG